MVSRGVYCNYWVKWFPSSLKSPLRTDLLGIRETLWKIFLTLRPIRLSFSSWSRICYSLFDLTFGRRDMAPQSWGCWKIRKMAEKTNFWTKRDRKTRDTSYWPSCHADLKKYMVDRVWWNMEPTRRQKARTFWQIEFFANFARWL